MFSCGVNSGRNIICAAREIDMFCRIGAFWFVVGGMSADNKLHLLWIEFRDVLGFILKRYCAPTFCVYRVDKGKKLIGAVKDKPILGYKYVPSKCCNKIIPCGSLGISPYYVALFALSRILRGIYPISITKQALRGQAKLYRLCPNDLHKWWRWHDLPFHRSSCHW